MRTRRIKDPKTDESVEVKVVEIESEENRPIRVRLKDGALLRIRLDVIEIARVLDRYDAEGNPVYVIRSAKTHYVLEPPIDL